MLQVYLHVKSPYTITGAEVVCPLMYSPNTFCYRAVVTFMYYGLSFNSGNIGSNMFVSFILTMLVEIPSYLFCWKTLDWLVLTKG